MTLKDPDHKTTKSWSNSVKLQTYSKHSSLQKMTTNGAATNSLSYVLPTFTVIPNWFGGQTETNMHLSLPSYEEKTCGRYRSLVFEKLQGRYSLFTVFLVARCPSRKRQRASNQVCCFEFLPHLMVFSLGHRS